MAKDSKKVLMTPPFLVAFPSLFEKSSYDDSTPKYSVTAVWTPAKFSAQDKALWQAILRELEDASQAAFKKPWKDLPENNRGIRDGKHKDLEGFGEGTRFANLSTLLQPGVFDLSGNAIMDSEEVYAGCIGQATVNIYSYNNKSKGTAIGLRNFRLIKKGKRIDGRGDGAKDFEGAAVDDSWLEAHTDNLLDNGTEDLDF